MVYLFDSLAVVEHLFYRCFVVESCELPIETIS